MKTFLKIWLIAFVVKTVLAIWLPLSNDEAYYWVWGHHPQWSYYDHPPMVGWLFWLGSWIDFAGASRLPGVWLGHFTLLIWNRILSPVLDEQKRAFWLVFVLFSPFFGLGSLIITPDVPLIFFWSLALIILLQMLKKPTPILYAALGFALGLGFCSKYLIVIFVPTALIWLAWSGEWRKIRWLWIPITIVTGLIACIPVLYWNYANEWASFLFQLNHGLVAEQRKLTWPLEYLGGQIALLLPPTIWLATRHREPKEARFLRFFGWLPLAFFLYTSFRARVEANWAIMAHLPLLTLAFLNMRDWKWLKAILVLWITALVIVISQVVYPWIPLEPRKLKTSEFAKFDSLLPKVSSTEHIYLGSYQMAGAISYKLKRQVYKLGGMNRRDFYDFLPQAYPDHDTFAVIAEVGHPLPEWLKNKGYFIVAETALTNEFKLFEVQKRAQGSDR